MENKLFCSYCQLCLHLSECGGIHCNAPLCDGENCPFHSDIAWCFTKKSHFSPDDFPALLKLQLAELDNDS